MKGTEIIKDAINLNEGRRKVLLDNISLLQARIDESMEAEQILYAALRKMEEIETEVKENDDM